VHLALARNWLLVETPFSMHFLKKASQITFPSVFYIKFSFLFHFPPHTRLRSLHARPEPYFQSRIRYLACSRYQINVHGKKEGMNFKLEIILEDIKPKLQVSI
jgi:hypothetical protein